MDHFKYRVGQKVCKILQKSLNELFGQPHGGTSGKEPTCQRRRHKRRGFDPWIGKIPWRRKGQPSPVFLPGESHGERNLAGCRTRGAWGACQNMGWQRVGHDSSDLARSISQAARVFSSICVFYICMNMCMHDVILKFTWP